MENPKFDGGEVSLILENVILVEYEIGKLITIRYLFELKKLRKNLLGNKAYHTITEACDGLLNISDEAKAYLADENQSSKNRLSDAVIVNSFTKKIEVELYIRLNKPVVKTNVFTDLNKALCWIEADNPKPVELV